MATMIHYNLLPLFSTLLFLLSLSGPLRCGATEYYVKPTEDTPCYEPCHTLVEYAKNASQYFTSVVNVTFLFLPGIHPFHNYTIYVHNSSNLSFQALLHVADVTILSSNGTFAFAYTTNLTIEKLVFSMSISITFDFITNLRIVGVTLEKGNNSSINAINVLGHSEITNLTIYRIHIKFPTNAVLNLWYDDTPSTTNIPTSNTLLIQDSHFLDIADGAVSLIMRQTAYTVEVDIIRVSINSYFPYSHISLDFVYFLVLDLVPTSSVIRIMNSKLTNTGLPLATSIVCRSQSSGPSTNVSTEGQVFISGCEIMGYTGPALMIYATPFQVTVVDSAFANNQEQHCYYYYCASAVAIADAHTPVTFINTTFEDNVSINPTGVASTVSLYGTNHVSFVDCSFHGNTGTPIIAINSTFHVSGNINFVNNTGKRGGAMALFVDSQVIIDDPDYTHILFQNNSAVVGGAIFVDLGYNLISYGHECFVSFDCTAHTSLNFTNNTAQYGGNAIYGAALDTCDYFCGNPFAQVIYSISYFEPSEDLSKITSQPSRVCLCDKNGKPDCASSIQSIYPPPKYHYPGETFTISAVIVGDEFGTINGSVHAKFLLLNRNRHSPHFGILQDAQRVGHSSCTDLKYSVQSGNGSEIIVLTAGESSVDVFADKTVIEYMIATYEAYGHMISELLPLLSLPVYLNITLLQCPLGFTLASPLEECVCNKRMQENNITCNITDQTLHRSGTLWINSSSANDGIIIAKYCPFYYCRSEEVAVNLSNPDSQCKLNHTDTLCGGCQPGLSLALGSSQCLSCSNTYLVLIIPFVIAGIALVFFIKSLNLTVSKGTMNGLIFYANIVGAVPSSFFPAGATNFLTVFIAWLNLDLGIETCFFDGLDAYWKTWLQFVFPAYIWAIIGLIILLSQLSERATKFFGSNSADVLATLLLLSYAKLFRTIISALSFSFLELPDGTRVAVWSLDGNIPYLSGKHIPLFLVALAVLLLLWLPFTTVLLFWQLLQRVTHYKIVQWVVVKKKPFFDTYFGPLKGAHRYWVGVLLLIRGILLIIFAVVPADDTGVHLLSISTVTIVLFTYTANLPQIQQQGGGRRAPAAAQQNFSLSQKVQDFLSTFSGWYYNSWYLSLLENSFILNLGVMSVATFYVYSSGGNQAAVVYTSVGIAFAQFVGIVCYHMFLPMKKWWKNHKGINGELLNVNRAEYERITDEPPPISRSPFLQEDSSEYREPVLEQYD